NAMTTAGATLRPLTRQDRDKLRGTLSASPFRPFLASVDQSSRRGPALNIHIVGEAIGHAVNASRRRMRRVVHSRVSALGFDVSVNVKFYRRSALEKSRSLEQLFVKFGRGERVYDPMGVFDEAERLVNFARVLRLRLADELKGIYWSARWR